MGSTRGPTSPRSCCQFWPWSLTRSSACASADLGTAPVTGEFADDLPYWHKYGASAEDQPCGVEEVSHRTLADIAEKGEDGVWQLRPFPVGWGQS